MAQRTLKIIPETFPLLHPFRISRGVKNAAELIQVEVAEKGLFGQGECCPYPHYGESLESVTSQIESVWHKFLDRPQLQDLLPPGAARNALDCALWDLEAKQSGVSVESRIGLNLLQSFKTMRTVGLDGPRAMAVTAKTYPAGTPLKVKLDMEDVANKLAVIKASAPESAIIVDANEGWDANFLKEIFPVLKTFGVVLLEQPLPGKADDALRDMDRLVPVCADESCHDRADLKGLKGKYDAINIKLDKTGGLTEALALLQEAKSHDFKIMLGCMVSSSLSIAPISHLCSHADFIDLDGPLLLKGSSNGGMCEVANKPFVKLTTSWGCP